MLRNAGSIIGCIALASSLMGQGADSLAHALRPKQGRVLAVCVGGGAAITATLITLDRTWYSDYPRSEFHTFNDGDEWMQMDKAGHAFSTYTVGRWGYGLMHWTGVKEKTAIWVGGSVGFAYNTALEILDGTSAQWGFSWWDMAANFGGTSLFIGQQLGWGEQRILLKYSAHLTDYAAQRPDLLGETLPQRLLKDYNGQTYWLSVNLHAFAKDRRWPVWLNIAAGYGADGMISAHPEADHEASPSDYPEPFRQFYLAPDISFSRIPTRSKILRTILYALDCVKIPAPTLEFRSTGEVVGHWLYF